MGLKIALIIHPHGDHAWVEALRTEVSRLRRAGHRVTPRLTFEAGDARLFARAAARARYDLVIAAGGDGTVNGVVNGIARCQWQPRLGIVPGGTANDFAASLGIPTSVAAAVETAVAGRPVAVDLARVGHRYFINVSTGGFAAEAVPSSSKRLLGPWAYLVTGARWLLRLRPARARFRVGAETLFEGAFLVFAVGNARQTGGGSLLTPRAVFGDSRLDVLIVPDMPRLAFLALLPHLRAGTHLERPDVLYLQTPELIVEAAEALPLNVDGEPLRGRRFHYRVEDRPLSVMLPR